MNTLIVKYISHQSEQFLTIQVISEKGAMIKELLLESTKELNIRIKSNYKKIFVRLTLPSQKTIIKEANFQENKINDIVFSDNDLSSPHEWMAWAVPLIKENLKKYSVVESKKTTVEAFLNVWIRVWKFTGFQWSIVNPPIVSAFKDTLIRQFEIDLDESIYLLQIGGSAVPWRFAALPGRGQCRILITPNSSKNPKADPIRVTVSSGRVEAENLLQYMSRESMRAASVMLSASNIATSLLYSKFTDPIAAIAGAYYLLKVGNWNKTDPNWWANLSDNFRSIPDCAILHCTFLLRNGIKDEEDQEIINSLFKQSLDNGWPIFSEGLLLLKEASEILKQSESNHKLVDYFLKVNSLYLASSKSGTSLSFYGRIPDKPSSVLWVGKPNAPRRKKLKRPEITTITSLPENIEKPRLLDVTEISVVSQSRKLTSLGFAREFYNFPELQNLSDVAYIPFKERQSGFARIAKNTEKKESITTTQNRENLNLIQNDWLTMNDIAK